MQVRNKTFDRLNTVFMIVLVSLMIIPLLNAFAVAFSSDLASMQPGIAIIPKDFSVEGFETVIRKLQFWRPFMNSVIVTSIGTFLHVMLSALAGYVLIQKDLKYNNILVLLILITMMVPSQAILVPQYVVFKELHLLNKLTGLVISQLVSGFSILLMRNYFLGIPYALYESALMDGANDLVIFFKIYMPSAKPGLTTVGLFELVRRWNNFMSPLLYISDPNKYTLQLALRAIILPNDTTSTADVITYNVQMAGVVISFLPLLIIYPFVQKYFVKGINIGAVKG